MPKIKQPEVVAPNQGAKIEEPRPSMDEVETTETFDDYVKEEIRESEIEEGLEEIYQDENGRLVDVQKINMKKRRGIIFILFSWLLTLAVLGGLGWFGYNYWYARNLGNSSAIGLTIEADKEIQAGKEFFYTVSYKNLDKVDLKDINIKLAYPENFIFLESSPAPTTGKDIWKIDTLEMRRSGEIKIKGKLIGETDKINILLATMTYTPANFSSEFTKEASFENKINETGVILEFPEADATSTRAVINENNEVVIKYKAKPENYLSRFRLTVESAENIEFAAKEDDNEPNVWQIEELSEKEEELKTSFKFKDKLSDNQNVVFRFDYSEDGQTYLPFFSKTISYEVLKKNLNLSLIVNGSRLDQGVNFGDTLNYTIAYANKGESELKDIVIMAVLESDFLDWSSLEDKNKGVVKDGKITWSKNEIPALEALAAEAEGTIDFAIKLKSSGDVDPTKNYRVESYARFSVGDPSTSSGQANSGQTNDENKSNVIINKINSDLSLKEQVRYFSDDNIAVGSGPLPPKVGQTTSYKIYWQLTNSLNELNDLKVEATLPANVNWDGKNQTDLGTIEYDNASRKITWNIGRLPITVLNTEAELNVSVTPTESDLNKIMVLLPGANITAIDSNTNTQINKTTKPKTTKLEDDQVISDGGRVVE